MAISGTKFNLTVQKMARGGASGVGFLLNADSLKMALSTGASAAPAVADAAYNTTITEVANGAGYTTGGVALTGVTANASGIETLKTSANFANPTWTASGAGFNFRYFVWYDSTTATTLTQNLATWDYGSNQALSGANGDQLDLSPSAFNTSWGTLQ